MADLTPQTEMDGRVVLVTGAGREGGLGAAVARALAEAGARVIVTARRAEDAQAVAGGIGAEAMALDITDPGSVEAARAAIQARHGRLDALVNNAADTTAFGVTVEGADLDAARHAMEVTLFGTWRMCRAFLPLLRDSEAGRIVNVSSGAGSHGDPVFGIGSGNGMGASYAVAKAALGALTHRLAVETGDVLVNAVCPGFTATFPGGAEMGARAPGESAPGVLWAAALGPGGPSGGFFRDGETLPW